MEYSSIIFLTSKAAVTALYSLSLLLLCIFGLHRFYLARLYLRYRNHDIVPGGYFDKLPVVTVQLPLYNERYVAKRLIDSICSLDYPRDLLDIQVLDDSTDDTSNIAEKCVDKYARAGFRIKLIRRKDRKGYKAGALENGLKTAQGEFIAMFDADFIPPADFLKNTIHHFTDSSVGIVQCRWGHINRDYSLLTRAQSILLDGHFIVEQTTRFRHGVFLNFNGTAGILRKECIEQSGGWEHDTLTEDLDLSYRAQMKGWRMIYLKDVVCDAELPVEINGFKSQQHRWVKGGIQTAKKLFLDIVRRKDLPLKVKAESFFHFIGNASYLLLAVLLTLMLPMGYFWRSLGWEEVFLINVFTVSAGMLSIFYFYMLAVKEAYGKVWLRNVPYVPVALAVGAGIAVNNSRAVLEAVFDKKSEFVRTPKYAITAGAGIRKITGYKPEKELTSLIEMTLGIFLFLQTVYAVMNGFLSWVPVLLMLQFGFIYTAYMSIFQGLRIKKE